MYLNWQAVIGYNRHEELSTKIPILINFLSILNLYVETFQ